MVNPLRTYNSLLFDSTTPAVAKSHFTTLFLANRCLLPLEEELSKNL